VSGVVTVDQVFCAYPQHDVLGGVSFAINAGEFVALTGGNGSGKSTLLRVVLGLLRPASGSVRILERHRIGYVPQRPMLSDGLPATVAEVVSAGRLTQQRWWLRPHNGDSDAVCDALTAVGLADHASRRFTDLSGGQQQRVLIAKAIVNDPDLLILDEPIAGVDAASQELFRAALVSRIQRGRAVLLVSHELSAVATALDRILLLAGGRIEFDGPPSDLEHEGVSLGMHRHDLPAWLEDRP
jgi:zinc transport system ATP-binding protein